MTVSDQPLWRHRQVLLIVSVGMLTSTVRWLEMLAVGVFVFDRTGSPFLVTLMTLLRMLPLAVCGAFIGALAERMGRRTILIVGLSVMASLTAIPSLFSSALAPNKASFTF